MDDPTNDLRDQASADGVVQSAALPDTIESISQQLESAVGAERARLLVRRAARLSRNDLAGARRDAEEALGITEGAAVETCAALRSRVHRVLTDCLHEQGEPTRALRHAERALELARESGDDNEVAHAVCALARRTTARGDAESAIAMLAELEAEWSRTQPFSLGRVSILGALGQAHFQRGDLQAASQSLNDEGLVLARIGSSAQLAVCHANRAVVAHASGDLAGALYEHGAAASIYRTSGNRRGLALALANAAGICVTLDDAENATRYALEAVDLARELGNRVTESRGKLMLAQARALARDFDGAVTAADEAIEIGRESGGDHLSHRALTVRADALRQAGELDRAEADCQAALSEAVAGGSQQDVVVATLVLGQVALAREDAPAAIEHLSRAVRAAAHAPDRNLHLRALDALHRAYEMAGDPATALATLREHIAAVEQLRGRADEAALARLRVEGEVSLARDREQRALQRSEALVAEIIRHTPNVAIQGVDGDGQILFWNPASESLFGWTESEMTGRPVDRLFADPGELREFRDGARHARSNGATYGPFEWRSRRKDGSEGAAVSTFFPVVDTAGEQIFICMDVDISERRLMEDALRERERRYRRIVEDQTEFIVRYEPGGILTFVNESYCRYFGRRAADLLGTSFFELIPEEEREAVHAKLSCLTLESPVQEEEHLVVAADGALRWNHWTDRALFDDRGNLVEYQAVGRDVHVRRVAEDRLREALNEVERLRDRLQAENIQLQAEIRSAAGARNVIGESPVLRELLAAVDRVAPTRSTVFISGETGSGKELVARTIHARSQRADRALVKVDCSSVAAGLVESELFGHERGAFTGAHAQRLGRCEIADGGTLFLDEIGELPLETQSKLLRVLEEGAFERVGSSTTISVDVRVIAATNRDLAEEVAAGRFRADLYYRLHVFPLDVPPLRARREDIPALAERFGAELSRRLGREFQGIHPASLEWMMEYDWPGNVRELRNVIERAVIVSPGPLLEHPSLMRTAVEPTDDGAPARLDDALRHHIVDALRRSRWTIEGAEGAAARLGVRPSTLRSRMQRLEIERPGSAE